MKTRVAVLFGGRSPEHDVSIVTGLQVLDALDQGRFEAFPVYLSTTGRWFVGEQLRERSFYLPGPDAEKKLTQVTLDLTPNDLGHGVLLPKDKGGLFSRAKEIAFDVALPAFHGLIGEDGQIQGAFETANVPYTGMRTLASAVLMDKAATKRLLAETRIPLLPCEVIDRPATGMLPSLAALAELTKALAFPVIVKPAHLGSSIGVAKVATVEELRAVLPPIFKLDNQAIVEPFVENLVEYNIAVAGFEGKVRTSAVERPKRASDLLDFKQKYLSGGAKGASPPAPAARACCRSPATSTPPCRTGWRTSCANGRSRPSWRWVAPAPRASTSSAMPRPGRCSSTRSIPAPARSRSSCGRRRPSRCCSPSCCRS